MRSHLFPHRRPRVVALTVAAVLAGSSLAAAHAAVLPVVTGSAGGPACSSVTSAGTALNADGTTSVVVLGDPATATTDITVPALVTDILVDVCGAQGEDGPPQQYGTAPSAGGRGGRSQVALHTTSGAAHTLRVVAGTRDGVIGHGGNGPGDGGNGGGLSAVQLADSAATALLAVGGGGGGAPGGTYVRSGGDGGQAAAGIGSSGAAQPGTLCAGGRGGVSVGTTAGQQYALGGAASADGMSAGGAGGSYSAGGIVLRGGGGGGGGLRGGGGGGVSSDALAGAAGGAAGSSFARKPGDVANGVSITSSARLTDLRQGQGAVVITYRLPVPVVAATASVVKVQDGAEAGSVPARFEARLSRTSPVSTSLTYSLGGTATRDADYTAPSTSTVLIPAGATSADLTFPVLDDQTTEGDESLTVTLSGTDNPDTVLDSNPTATAVIADDDAAQDTLALLAPSSAEYASTATVSTTGGSGTGAVSYAATGTACRLVGDRLTMTAGSGTCSVTATKAASAGFAAATSAPVDVIPSPRSVSGSFTASDKTYDGGTSTTVLMRSLDRVVAGDQVSLTGGTAAFQDQHAGAGKAVALTGAALSGADAQNYTLSSVQGSSATISPKSVSGTFTAADRTYNRTVSATVVGRSLVRVVGDDAVALTGGTAAFNSATAGRDKPVTLMGAVLSGSASSDYTLTGVAPTTASVVAAGLIGSVTVAPKTYDGTTDAVVTGRSLQGAASGDDVELTGGTASFDNPAAGAQRTARLAGATLTGADAANYTLASVSATAADIAPRAVTGRFTAADRAYDATTAAAVTSRSLVGILDTDSVALTGGTASFADSHTGTSKATTLVGATLAGAQAGDYVLDGVTPASAAVTARQLSGSFTAADRTFDGTSSADVLTRALQGVLGSDEVTLTGGTASFDSPHASSARTVTLSGAVLTGAAAGDYVLASVGSTTAGITPARVTGTFTVPDRTYDGSVDATPTARTLSGVLRDDVVVLSGGTARFDSAHVGTGRQVTLIGATLKGSSALDYRLDHVAPATADITPRPVIGAFSAANKTYDGSVAATATVRTLTGVLGDDDVRLTGGTATFDSPHVGAARQVLLAGASLSGPGASDYGLDRVEPAHAAITRRPVTGSFTAADKPYDGTTTARVLARRLAGAVGDDDLKLQGGDASFASAATGTWIVDLVGASLGGVSAADYVLLETRPAMATIAAPPVVDASTNTGSSDTTSQSPSPSPSPSEGTGTIPSTGTVTSGGTLPSSSPATSQAAPSRLLLQVPGQEVVPGARVPVVVHGRAGEAVELRAYSRPSTHYLLVRTGVLDSSGSTTFVVTPGTNTRLFAAVPDQADTASSSAVILVRSALSLSATRTTSGSYAFRGTVLPRQADVLVTVYRVAGTGDVIVGQTRSDATGLFHLQRRFSGTGLVRLVARSGATIVNASGLSNSGQPVALLLPTRQGPA